ncbi:alanine racemase [Hamadaea tsunoensis]|uniref:alanine racemase n=1 Tax=Hamadaea tsunoensis TaxID=53368 RepID=UPI0004066F75|nr:alanine racemase [Hamadaea tsunoensis]
MNLLALRPQATLQVDLDAVTANVRTIRARTRGEVMAVVKADGFGHGQLDVARAALAGGATRLGVTSIDEARPLRAGGLTVPVLSWLNALDADFAAAVGLGLELGVPGLEHLHAVARTAPGARIHLQLDTGMGRDGAEPAEWDQLCRDARVAEQLGLVRVVGVMGHLPCADRPGHPANARGRDRFAWGLRVAEAAGLRPVDRHLAATAATLSDPLSHHTMSRIGAGLVGIDESGTVRLRPALTLTAPLVTVRRVPAGTPVGYGHTWTARRATRLGLIPVGYADGLPRLASGRAEVWVGGVRRPVAGRISMDMTVVDLGPDTAAAVGDHVTVFGPGSCGEPTTADWAGWAETLEHEIVTGLSARLHRRSSS